MLNIFFSNFDQRLVFGWIGSSSELVPVDEPLLLLARAKKFLASEAIQKEKISSKTFFRYFLGNW